MGVGKRRLQTIGPQLGSALECSRGLAASTGAGNYLQRGASSQRHRGCSQGEDVRRMVRTEVSTFASDAGKSK